MTSKLQFQVKLSKTIYSSENYQVVVFKANSENKKTFIAAGEFPKLSKHEELIIEGYFTKKNNKEQFKVETWKRPTPTDREQIISFFSSSLFKGIGKKTALSIYKALGDKAIVKVNKYGMNALKKVEGLSKEKAAVIALITQQTFLLNDIIEQYQNYGVNSDVIIKAHSKLSNRVIELKENPYLLAQQNLVHFRTSDDIGMKMGLMPHSRFRLETVLCLFLKEISRLNGHCFIEEEILIKKCLEILNYHVVDESDLVHPMSLIAMMEESKHCYIEEGKIYPTKLYYAEKEVAKNIHRLMLGTNQYQSLQVSKAIHHFEKEQKTQLSNEQKDAIYELMQENILFLTGGPGTGKTFTVSAILNVYNKIFPTHKVSLAAPTGRAAKRLGEVTGQRNNVQTIHRLLGIGGFGSEAPQYHKDNLLDCDLIIVDEFSMVDIELAKYLFNAIKLGAKVLIVGDPDQLPSVNAGNVLKDCLDAGLPQVHLTQIFRQAQNSTIVKNAHKINKGEMIDLENHSDSYFIECNDPKRTANLIAHSVKKLITQGYSLSDIMVLSPMKNGSAGIYEINSKIQNLVNPPDGNKREVNYKGIMYREGDKIMYLVNNKDRDIFNGDIGIITKISKGVMRVDFDGNVVDLEKEDWKDIQLAFCSTIHKSQGNQAKINIMCLCDEQKIMLVRNLFYTGITRTEDKFILIGSERAIKTAINTTHVNSRKTNLKNKIIDERKYITNYQLKNVKKERKIG